MVVWLGMVKVTFTLDDETVGRLRRVAGRLGKAQSQVVREAVREYEARSDRLSDEERTRMVSVLDAIMRQPPTRSELAVDAELGSIRAARRRGGRVHPARTRR
jgi:metal-responsive CopG/Arc/MetJ family transcriptional regulator